MASDVKQNGYALKHAAPEHASPFLAFAAMFTRRWSEIVLEAVKQDGNALQYAAPEHKADREVVFEAEKQNGCALKSATPEHKAGLEVVFEAVKQNGSRSMQNAALKQARDVARAAAHRQRAASAAAAAAKATAQVERVAVATRTVLIQQRSLQEGAFKHSAPEHKANWEVVPEAVKQN